MRTSAYYFKGLNLTSSHYNEGFAEFDDKQGKLTYTSVQIDSAVDVKHEVVVLPDGKAVTSITITDDSGVKNEINIFHK